MATTPAARSSRPSRPAPSLELPEEISGIYELALTHRSYAFEQPEAAEHNERLEFLGDAILGAVVTAMIFRDYPGMTEGEMARLRASVVNTNALADLARAHGIGPRLRLGKGEETSGGREKSSLLSDAFEAVVGALYIDRGPAEVTRILEPIFEPLISGSAAAVERFDAKTALQEEAVRATSELPEYRVAASGPDHDRRYEADVYLLGELFGTGRGRSKKEAEQNAARVALRRLSEGGLDARAG